MISYLNFSYMIRFYASYTGRWSSKNAWVSREVVVMVGAGGTHLNFVFTLSLPPLLHSTSFLLGKRESVLYSDEEQILRIQVDGFESWFCH